MDVFNRRLSVVEVAEIIQAAQHYELLYRGSSAIIHHLGLMRARIVALQSAFPKDCMHTVAIKANPVVEILREVVGTGVGLEAASIEEVELALAAGCRAERVVYDSPAKTVAEIDRCIEWGVYLNADNFDELDRIAYALKKRNSASLVGLRINAMVGSGTIEHTSVSAASSRFGVLTRCGSRKNYRGVLKISLADRIARPRRITRMPFGAACRGGCTHRSTAA